LIEAGGGFVNLQKLCYTTGDAHREHHRRPSNAGVPPVLAVFARAVRRIT